MDSGCCLCRQPPGKHTQLHRHFGLPATGLSAPRNSASQMAHRATPSFDASLWVLLVVSARSTCPSESSGLCNENAGWCRRPNPVSGLESSAIPCRSQSHPRQQSAKKFTLSIRTSHDTCSQTGLSCWVPRIRISVRALCLVLLPVPFSRLPVRFLLSLPSS